MAIMMKSIALVVLLAIYPFSCFGQPVKDLGDDNAYSPKFIVLTAFPPEWDAWHKKTEFQSGQLTIPGLSKRIMCSKDAICIVDTGEGQVNAAVSVTALLTTSKLSLSKTIFIRSGTAGGVYKHSSPIGSVYINSWVLGWGLGRHYLDKNKKLAWTPPNKWDQVNNVTDLSLNVAYQINPYLLKEALSVAGSVKLDNSDEARRIDILYGIHSTPRVMQGATITANNYWSGREQQDIAEKIVETYTKGQGIYTNVAMEDIGDLDALSRFGLANHYLSIRAISDIDIRLPSQKERLEKLNLAGIPDFTELAVRNAMLVTETILHQLPEKSISY